MDTSRSRVDGVTIDVYLATIDDKRMMTVRPTAAQAADPRFEAFQQWFWEIVAENRPPASQLSAGETGDPFF